ncbi:MAG: mannose-1-phosphate guanylyltransferase [Chthoniobacterales bacterium]
MTPPNTIPASFQPPASSLSSRLFIFIMAGGSGERFWPASRKTTPKHLLRLLSEETLLEQTVRRFQGMVPLEQIFILTNEAQWEATCRALPKHPTENIISEPTKRDTAPAATLATALALRQNPNAIVGLFPADAMIHEEILFREQVLESAALAAESDALITFSIEPSHPSISFGYLELGKILPHRSTEKTIFRSVDSFVEKPPLEKAKEFLASGYHGWNAGMFLWQATTFLEECCRQQPLLATFAQELLESNSPSKFILEKFEHLPKISVDYAIMEHAKQVIAAIATFDWDDVGHWTALPQHLGTDAAGNTIKSGSQGIVMHDSMNNIVISQDTPEKTIALCGVENLVVVQTQDALLICHRDAVEKIKQLPLPDELR